VPTAARPPPAKGRNESDPISVFDYLDHRAFLRDYYLDRKQRRGQSFRSFSRRAGLGSPNYLKLVIDGHRNLTDRMAARFAQAAGLTGDAAQYFVELVRFARAKTSSERAEHYQKITGFQRFQKARPLDAASAAYHSKWYLPAVRELAARADFSDDPHWIASTLWPSISPSDAKEALETLLSLGLLVRSPDGRIVQGDVLVSTGAEVRSLVVANYHRVMLERASASIDAVPPDQRDISSLTLCLGADGLRRLKERVQRFRRELLDLSALEEDPAQVVQMNFQLFPLSRADSGGRK
jgi:uncharacterized protein (TIGR02147 family)